MTKDREKIRIFRQEYLDFIEGFRTDPPSTETLDENDRKSAERWIASLDAARGVDPFASRPSTAELLARAEERRQVDVAGEFARTLEASLQRTVDPNAMVSDDVASMGATERHADGSLHKSLLIQSERFGVRRLNLPTSCGHFIGVFW